MDRNDVLARVAYRLNKSSHTILSDVEQEYLENSLEELDQPSNTSKESEDDEADIHGMLCYGNLTDVDPDHDPYVHLPDMRVEQIGDDMRQEGETSMQIESDERRQQDFQENEPVGPVGGFKN